MNELLTWINWALVVALAILFFLFVVACLIATPKPKLRGATRNSDSHDTPSEVA